MCLLFLYFVLCGEKRINLYALITYISPTKHGTGCLLRGRAWLKQCLAQRRVSRGATDATAIENLKPKWIFMRLQRATCHCYAFLAFALRIAVWVGCRLVGLDARICYCSVLGIMLSAVVVESGGCLKICVRKGFCSDCGLYCLSC